MESVICEIMRTDYTRKAEANRKLQHEFFNIDTILSLRVHFWCQGSETQIDALRAGMMSLAFSTLNRIVGHRLKLIVRKCDILYNVIVSLVEICDLNIFKTSLLSEQRVRSRALVM